MKEQVTDSAPPTRETQDTPKSVSETESKPRFVDALRDGASASAEFIHTDTAEQLLDTFEERGLRVGGRFKDELQTEGDKRYGSPYAWISRQLARSIAREHTRGDKYGFFVVDEEWSDEKDDYVELPLAIDEISLTSDPAANVIIDQLQQVYRRDMTQDPPYESDLPLAAKQAKFNHYGCKDVEEYFSQSLAEGKVDEVTIAGKVFWHKQKGGPTFLNCEEVVHNGIVLPPGCVFRREDDGGFVMLRITGFAFDQSTAEKVMGSGMTHDYGTPGVQDKMTSAFDSFATRRAELQQQEAAA